MSAQHAPHDADAPAPRHDLIPEGFVAAMNAQTAERVTTVAHALRVAESLPSSTDRDQLRRCPACLSTKPRRRPDADHFACGECSATFASPLPALVDARRRADHAPAAGPLPACPDCGADGLYPVPESASAVDARWLCGACGGAFDRAGSRQTTLREVTDG